MVSVMLYPCICCVALLMDLFVFCGVYLTVFVNCLGVVVILLFVCMSEVISSFRSLRAGSQVFALLMLFLCVILHTRWSGKSLQLLCILPFGMLCLSVGCVGGYGGLSESELCLP